MSGDVVARASRLAGGIDSGQWDVVREQGEFYGVYKGEFGRRVAGLIHDRREAEFIAAARTLVPELVDEIERKSAQLAEWIAQYQDREAEVEKLRGAMDNHQATIFQIQEARVDYNAALNRREHGAVGADHFMRNVFSALDIHAAVIERAGIEP